MTKRDKTLYTEIIECLEAKLQKSKTDRHYKDGVFKETRGAVHHALADVIGQVKAIKGTRDLKAKGITA